MSNEICSRAALRSRRRSCPYGWCFVVDGWIGMTLEEIAWEDGLRFYSYGLIKRDVQ